MEVKNYLLSKNIQPKMKGFRYLVTAIEMCQEQGCAKHLYDEIYPAIALLTNAKPENIARDVFYALSKTGMSATNFIARALLDLEENK